ncbi:MAG: SDR family oxidoreductase [Gloeomargaritaceae cyanobacterium C42_A2020_066]|nr:SDR family oxidoreductase [Gloeomargaritaceae cyanobacterium C42_A2020_066]
MLQGKVALVVGATGGIGSALCARLAGAGSQVILVGRQRDRLIQVAAGLPNPGAHTVLPTDITDPAQVTALFDQIGTRAGRLDVMVNAAGAGILKPWNKLGPADLEAMLAVNLKGSFYTCQGAAQIMKEQRGGHICNVVGILGKHTMPLAAAYSAAKFGVVGFSKCWADEWRRYGIKVTLFYFGGVDTPFWDTEQVNLKVDRTKMLRPATAADAILFALQAEPQAVPLEINIQPESHVFF